jgi:hypothetical protein
MEQQSELVELNWYLSRAQLPAKKLHDQDDPLLQYQTPSSLGHPLPDTHEPTLGY